MITEDLYNKVLIEPVSHLGANKLFVIAGYATSAMSFHHLENLQNIDNKVSIDLIIGMCGQDGLSVSNHKGFQQLMNIDFSRNFNCSYLVNKNPVHSKVYIWYKDHTPICAYSGSANYTQTAFGNTQGEVMESSNPEIGLKYFNSFTSQTIYCTHNEAEDLVLIFNDKYPARKRREKAQHDDSVLSNPPIPSLLGLESVKISLLDFHDPTYLPSRSGLNWGQRPELHREPNQAYIHLPAAVYNTEFFPARTVHFTVLTDDGKVLICTRAQANGKAIHTPQNNSLIGEYFRNRLGLANGQQIVIGDLKRYGRSDVVFYKIDEETYYMDFSVP